jgi:Tfp pilus assembly protein PilZ
MPSESPEKRQNPRVPIDTTVSYSRDGIVWREGRTININATGLLFQADAEFQSGERLHLVFRLPNRPETELIEAKARVRRAATRRNKFNGLVVEFFYLRTEHSHAIKDFIRRLKHQPPPKRRND